MVKIYSTLFTSFFIVLIVFGAGLSRIAITSARQGSDSHEDFTEASNIKGNGTDLFSGIPILPFFVSESGKDEISNDSIEFLGDAIGSIGLIRSGGEDIQASVTDVGFYNPDIISPYPNYKDKSIHKRIWYGRYGKTLNAEQQINEDELRLVNTVYVQALIFGPLDGEVRIEVRRSIVGSRDSKVMEFITNDPIHLERGECVIIKTIRFSLDSANDHDGFGSESGYLEKYYVNVRTHDPLGNDIVFGEDERRFEIGELSMLDPYGRDADRDSLSDGEEEEEKRWPGGGGYGTNPTQADTDFDTLHDDVEINDIGSNPINPDTDGDGLSDGWEWDHNNTEGGIDILVGATGGTLSGDYDGDGVTNIEEGIQGTDPYDNDSYIPIVSNNTDHTADKAYIAYPYNPEGSLSLSSPIIVFFVIVGVLTIFSYVKRKK